MIEILEYHFVLHFSFKFFLYDKKLQFKKSENGKPRLGPMSLISVLWNRPAPFHPRTCGVQFRWRRVLQGLFSSVISVRHRWFSSQDSWQPLRYMTGGNFSTKRGIWRWLPVPPKINSWKVLILPTWIENQNWLGLHVVGYGPLTLLSDQKIHLLRRVSELWVSVLTSLTDDTVDWMP